MAARSTRQLLGDLDALMDQMLALPVEEGAQPVATIEPPARSAAPAVTRAKPRPPVHPLAVTMTLLDVPPAEEMEHADPPPADEPVGPPSLESSIVPAVERAPEPPVPSTWIDESDLVPDPPPAPTHVAPRFATPVVPPAPRLVVVQAPPPPIRPLPSRPISRTYGWALRLNRMLARRTYGLGFMGRLVRSDAGRMLLGVAGILMGLIAVGWLLKDLLHWT